MTEECTPIERYRRAARRHGEATEAGNDREANDAHDQLVAALEELNTNPRGLGALDALLDDQDTSVRCWAAAHLLPTGSERAIDALESLANGTGIIAFDAKQVLKQWRRKRN